MKKIVFMCFMSVILIACSSGSNTPGTDNPDSGTTPGLAQPGPVNEVVPASPSSPSPSDAGSKDGGPTNQATCITACEVSHPNAAKLSHDLDDACMTGGTCSTVCDNLGQGTNKPPSVIANASCDTVTAKSYPIGTPSEACSDCLATTPACCTLWIDIFGSVEGQDLNACAGSCWATFQN